MGVGLGDRSHCESQLLTCVKTDSRVARSLVCFSGESLGKAGEVGA
ncbi:hypothetical protein [Nostoc sp. T09]|nr:hypothetical protein [Nostoc sp. T09]